ncbi:cyclin-like protein [Lactarius vividus]|nr:cyclin-like protein [Lactarius vividus]
MSTGTVTVRRRLYPLASLSQIQSTPSAQDGVPHSIEEDLRAHGCKLIHQAGILLNQSVSSSSQKQVAVATAQILLQRFFYVSSLKQFSVADVGMGALFLSSKLEECPVRMRDLINVYDLLLQRAAHTVASTSFVHPPPEFKYAPMSYFGNTFYDLREALVVSEMQILKRLGFDVEVVLPYGTLVNYMRLLGLTSRNEAMSMAWGYLNDATLIQWPNRLQTPVYALYAVPTVVSAAILLTTRQLGIALPSDPTNCWWELFDVDWEDLWSVCGYVMRLYRERTIDERVEIMGLLTKRDFRQWLENKK